MDPTHPDLLPTISDKGIKFPNPLPKIAPLKEKGIDPSTTNECPSLQITMDLGKEIEEGQLVTEDFGQKDPPVQNNRSPVSNPNDSISSKLNHPFVPSQPRPQDQSNPNPRSTWSHIVKSGNVQGAEVQTQVMKLKYYEPRREKERVVVQPPKEMATATATAWKPKNLPQKPENSRSAEGKSIIFTVEFVSPELPTISAVADVNPITSTQAQEQQITQNFLEALPPSQNEQDSQVYSILESTCMLPAHPSLQSPNSFESLQVQEGQLVVDIGPSTRKHSIESHQLNTKGNSTKKKKGKKKHPITGRLRMF
ncbi:unnamed protein product [Ilex paraguariensis]|uniref:Uncharacterized protein n=1 Tax=Ilex paraguariensis TaxID=185542 RepID=A0ABC8SFL9_9AQUA